MLQLASGVALLAACSGDVVNIGDGEPPPEPLPSYSRCLDSTTLEGTVVVSDQAGLDALDGCETIQGDVFVQPYFYPDLTALHALREVTGELSFSVAPPQDGEGETSAESRLSGEIYGKWLPTFAGLERLERAGSLFIGLAAATDLEPLSGLRELTGEGRLYLERTAVRDLAPLAQLRGIRSLFVDGDQLESIADLALPPRMTGLGLGGPQLVKVGGVDQVRSVSGAFYVSNTALRDLSALSALEEVGSLGIGGNALLETLDGLEQLKIVGDLASITDNPALRDLDALSGLQVAGALQVYGNASLKRVPDFPELLTREIGISNNPELEEIVNFTGEQRRWGVLIDGTYRQMEDVSELSDLQFRYEFIGVFNNPKLRAYTLPKDLRGAKSVIIANNASLADLDLGSVEAVDMLSIKANPALAHVALGALATVDLLGVQGNPLLPLETFDPVRTFERRMSSDPIPPPDCSGGECAP
ncbi:MAG TPA: hypothetical protein VMG12_01555 [Polyangiaceae bacterium]|nr:hypothetical protein [Polyangiaceae bacterium]